MEKFASFCNPHCMQCIFLHLHFLPIYICLIIPWIHLEEKETGRCRRCGATARACAQTPRHKRCDPLAASAPHLIPPPHPLCRGLVDPLLWPPGAVGPVAPIWLRGKGRLALRLQRCVCFCGSYLTMFASPNERG